MGGLEQNWGPVSPPGPGLKPPLCNADIIMCREYKLACLNWCCQMLLCFDGELYLVH